MNLVRQDHPNLWLEIQATILYKGCTPSELADWLREAADYLESGHGDK